MGGLAPALERPRSSRAVELEAASARFLGVIHRGVGMLEQRDSVFAVVREQGNAETCAQCQVATLQLEPTLHQLQDAPGHNDGIFRALEIEKSP